MIGLYYLNPLFTLYTFILPGILCAWAMMLGNFTQHMFIDPNITEYKDFKSYKYNCALTFQVMNHFNN